eukprot:3394595-Rhodomonas_salina.1
MSYTNIRYPPMPSLLRACYAMFGYRHTPVLTSAILLRAPYAQSGTESGYPPRLSPYARPTRSPEGVREASRRLKEQEREASELRYLEGTWRVPSGYLEVTQGVPSGYLEGT